MSLRSENKSCKTKQKKWCKNNLGGFRLLKIIMRVNVVIWAVIICYLSGKNVKNSAIYLTSVSNKATKAIEKHLGKLLVQHQPAS